MVPAGGGDAGVPGRFQDADGQVAQGGHGLGSAAGADLGGVFAVADVAEVVQGLDLPVAADPAGWGQVPLVPGPPQMICFDYAPRSRNNSSMTVAPFWITGRICFL